MGLYAPRGLPLYLSDSVPWRVRLLLPQPRTEGGARRVMVRSQRRGAEVAKLFTGSYVRPDRIKTMPLAVARAERHRGAYYAHHRSGSLVWAEDSPRLQP